MLRRLIRVPIIAGVAGDPHMGGGTTVQWRSFSVPFGTAEREKDVQLQWAAAAADVGCPVSTGGAASTDHHPREEPDETLL